MRVSLLVPMIAHVVVFLWMLSASSSCLGVVHADDDNPVDQALQELMNSIYRDMRRTISKHYIKPSMRRHHRKLAARRTCLLGTFTGINNLYHLDEMLKEQRKAYDERMDQLFDAFAEVFVQHLTLRDRTAAVTDILIERQAESLSQSLARQSHGPAKRWKQMFQEKVKHEMDLWNMAAEE